MTLPSIPAPKRCVPTGRRTGLAVVAVAAGLALSACSSGSASNTASSVANSAGAAASSAASAAATNASSAATGASSAASSALAGSTAQDGAKVNANTASAAEIAAALDKAGVANAQRWAREIEEYRPYTAADMPDKLGKELGKYGIDRGTLDKILATLKAS
ncbi:MAG: hypothetical protein M9891_18180 [Austwickia sp.]|nr:hypothetical protein [Actinomycetota bacterium]MCB1253221.1 hypothetical protein [Austwickia sp.]MCO5311174.1 hypothetical protein [Austwickia sp.]